MTALKTTLIAISLSVAMPAYSDGGVVFLPDLTFPKDTKSDVATKNASTTQPAVPRPRDR